MIYFFFIVFFSTFVFLKNNVVSLKNESYVYYWFVLAVALALGLRGNEDEYTRVYLLIPTLDNFLPSEHAVIHEKGLVFSLISSFFKTLSFNSQSIFIFFSFFGVFLHAIYYRKFTEYYFIAFLLYISHELCFKEWVGLRMGAASALLLPMIYYLDKGRVLAFLTLVGVATLIQYVAILSLLLLFLNRRIDYRLLFLGLIISILLLQSTFISQFVWHLDSIGYLPKIVSSYLRAESYVYNVGLFHPKTIQQIITITILLVLFSFKENCDFKAFNLLFNAYYLSTIFLIIFSEMALLAFRFGGHFYSVEPILLAYAISLFKQKKIASNVLSFLAIVIAYLNYVVLERVSPYDFLVNYPV